MSVRVAAVPGDGKADAAQRPTRRLAAAIHVGRAAEAVSASVVMGRAGIPCATERRCAARHASRVAHALAKLIEVSAGLAMVVAQKGRPVIAKTR